MEWGGGGVGDFKPLDLFQTKEIYQSLIRMVRDNIMGKN